MAKTLTDQEIEARYQEIRALSNRAKYVEAHRLANRLTREFPGVLVFEFCEAVMLAEDDEGYSRAEIRRRHAGAARKLKPLLRRLRAASPHLKAAIRNEYYWFSHQPYKQYRLGKSQERLNARRATYSQGVGAAELAKRYGLAGRRAACLRWARISEKAWRRFFVIDPTWFNGYFFLAMALGYQGKSEEMENALRRAADLAGKTPRWKAIAELRRQIEDVVEVVTRAN